MPVRVIWIQNPPILLVTRDQVTIKAKDLKHSASNSCSISVYGCGKHKKSVFTSVKWGKICFPTSHSPEDKFLKAAEVLRSYGNGDNISTID